ncbi:MAG: GAK system XXXCH domain-containing protein [Desulfovibrionaceae bacterium]|nr:GAK system XXXCH domain-containing protein [Desulfovibrionaceae bacterium]
MKVSKYVDRTELAAFFRRLADALENGGSDELECVDAFKKMKIGVKEEFGQLHLKAKIKVPDACLPSEEDEGGETPAKPKYSSLKKRMKTSFKVIVKMIHEDRTPPAEAVESFLADSALMVTYPGYGDEYYESYMRACDGLAEAFEDGDMEKLHRAVDALIHEKTRCHAKYD